MDPTEKTIWDWCISDIFVGREDPLRPKALGTVVSSETGPGGPHLSEGEWPFLGKGLGQSSGYEIQPGLSVTRARNWGASVEMQSLRTVWTPNHILPALPCG